MVENFSLENTSDCDESLWNGIYLAASKFVFFPYTSYFLLAHSPVLSPLTPTQKLSFSSSFSSTLLSQVLDASNFYKYLFSDIFFSMFLKHPFIRLEIHNPFSFQWAYSRDFQVFNLVICNQRSRIDRKWSAEQKTAAVIYLNIHREESLARVVTVQTSWNEWQL